MIFFHFQGKPFNIIVIQVYAPTSSAEEAGIGWLHIPRLRSGAEAQRTPCLRGSGQEELTHIRCQEWQPRVPGCDSAGAAERSYPTSEARSSGWEEQPHIQGAVACPGAGGPREAIPRSRSGGAAVKRYPSSKVRNSSCAVLEQL